MIHKQGLQIATLDHFKHTNSQVQVTSEKTAFRYSANMYCQCVFSEAMLLYRHSLITFHYSDNVRTSSIHFSEHSLNRLEIQ